MKTYDYIIFIIGTLTLMLFAFTLVIFLIVHKKKQYHNLLEKQTMENNYQNQLLLSKLEVQEQSFRYFSEEIHDNIGQLLSIVKMQLYNIRNSSREKEIVDQATSSNELLGKAIHDLRNISHTLNSGFIANAGLVDAVEKDLEYIRSAKGVDCWLVVDGEEYSIGNERELLVFRIIQEALGNAVKHAGPAHIEIGLNYGPGSLEVTVRDNGSGFKPGAQKDAGIGLINMQVRATMLKGELKVTSEPEKGTTIRLVILTNANNPEV
jgi:signal transduction histidine kinase